MDQDDASEKQLPCAVCEFHSKTCTATCPFRPYFPVERRQKFLNALNLFSFDYLVAIVTTLRPHVRAVAVKSAVFEADARAKYPVLGPCHVLLRFIHLITHQKRELELVKEKTAEHKALCHRNKKVDSSANSARRPDSSGQRELPRKSKEFVSLDMVGKMWDEDPVFGRVGGDPVLNSFLGPREWEKFSASVLRKAAQIGRQPRTNNSPLPISGSNPCKRKVFAQCGTSVVCKEGEQNDHDHHNLGHCSVHERATESGNDKLNLGNQMSSGRKRVLEVSSGCVKRDFVGEIAAEIKVAKGVEDDNVPGSWKASGGELKGTVGVNGDMSFSMRSGPDTESAAANNDGKAIGSQ